MFMNKSTYEKNKKNYSCLIMVYIYTLSIKTMRIVISLQVAGDTWQVT
jgi:hypothetical protein